MLLILGCGQQEVKQLNIDADISSIAVTTIINGSDFVIDDEIKLNEILKIFKEANKEEGIVDMADPEYQLLVTLEDGNKKILYLWLGEEGEGSSLMKAEDTHTIYSISSEMTSKLKALMAV
ncbi:hypothetical protein [Cytobacillus gottheilii]|uniref:hypothetical protein n=1 Tax=Cytobacillus gottheilii TaxID=859144 RepID=UPI000830C8CD|nr:hypothetical protein [Cytobacillus gottheilii]